jgi:hypothetical protein
LLNLTHAVLASKTPCGYGDAYVGNLNSFEIQMVKSISKRQRRKYFKYGIVAEQVLRIAYECGCLPGITPPQGGMKLKRLIEWLGTGPYRDDENRELALWFRNKIIEDWRPKWTLLKKKSTRRRPH